MIRSLSVSLSRSLCRSKSSAAKACQGFDIQNVKNQLAMAEEFVSNKLKDLKPDTAMEGKLFGNVEVTIKKRTVKLKEIAEVSQKNNSHWMILVSDEAWTKNVQKAIKTDFPHLSPTEKDDHTILVSVPPVSKERKLELLKDMKQMVEKSRQAVRNIRASARADLKKGSFTSDQRFKAEKLIQHLVDESLKNIDGLHNDKQKSFEK